MCSIKVPIKTTTHRTIPYHFGEDDYYNVPNYIPDHDNNSIRNQSREMRKLKYPKTEMTKKGIKPFNIEVKPDRNRKKLSHIIDPSKNDTVPARDYPTRYISANGHNKVEHRVHNE